MKIPELKARIGALLDIPVTDIILNKAEEDVTPSFAMQGEKLVITFSDANTLTHEFLHACFTPRETRPDLLLNALEDLRISKCAEVYDKQLAKANAECMTDEMYEDTIRNVSYPEDREVEDTLRTLSAVALPLQSKVKPIELLEETLDDKNPLKNQIIERVQHARRRAELDSSFRSTRESFESLSPYMKFPKEQNQKGSTDNVKYDEDVKVEDMKEETIKAKAKHNVAEGTVYTLSTQEEFILKTGLRKIIQNRAIGKTYNTNEGKLAGKRLGRYPSTYLFKQKTRPSPQTKVYLFIDLSGSMMHDKLRTVSKFINTARELKIKDLDFELRGFNSKYWVNNQIPREFRKLVIQTVEARDPETRDYSGGYNDDAHWLSTTIDEINEDECENKCLLILSDGRPAPSGKFDEEELKDVVRDKLIPSGIPYMSIGIEDESVESYYPNSKVAWSSTELVENLSKYARELVKFN